MDIYANLTKLYAILAALVWLVRTDRLSEEDQSLARELKASAAWESLTNHERQWIDMLIGANLSPDTYQIALDILKEELPEVLR